jgi:hypothetical protein
MPAATTKQTMRLAWKRVETAGTAETASETTALTTTLHQPPRAHRFAACPRNLGAALA